MLCLLNIGVGVHYLGIPEHPSMQQHSASVRKIIQMPVDRLKWMADHPERWEAMAYAGRAHVEAEFDAPEQGPRLAAYTSSHLRMGGRIVLGARLISL